MPIVIKPKKMMVSKDAMKGGGGMDIATRRDALADKLAKLAKAAMTGGKSLSDKDVEAAIRRMRGMVKLPKTGSPARGGVPKQSRGMPSARRKEGMKARKMAKGGTAGGKKKMMMMGGGKTKKMMRGGGKTKKYMSRGGKAR